MSKGPSARVHHAVRAGHAGGKLQLLARIDEVVVDARVEFRLLRAVVLVVRIRSRAAVRDEARRTRERIGHIGADRQLVGPPVVDRRRMRAAHEEDRGAVGLVLVDFAIHRAGAEGHARAQHLARALGDDVDDAVERVGAPDRRCGTANHLDALDLVEVRRHELPHRQPEEVLVDAPPVNHGQLGGRQRRRRTAGVDVDVARGNLRDVDARNGPEQIGIVVRRRDGQSLRTNDGHRGRCVHDLLLDLGGRDDDGFLEGRILGLGRRLLRCRRGRRRRHWLLAGLLRLILR